MKSQNRSWLFLVEPFFSMLHTFLLIACIVLLVIAIFFLWAGIKLFQNGPRDNFSLLQCQRLFFLHLELHRHVNVFSLLSMELTHLKGQSWTKDTDLKMSIDQIATRSKQLNCLVVDIVDQLANSVANMEFLFSEEVFNEFGLFLDHARQTLYPAQELSVQLSLAEGPSELIGLPNHFISLDELQQLWNCWHSATEKLFAEIKSGIQHSPFDIFRISIHH